MVLLPTFDSQYYQAWAPLVAQLVKKPPAMQRPWFNSWVGKIPWRKDRLPTPVFLGFPGGSDGKESACNAGDLGSISGLGRYPGEGKGYPLQYSGLENSMDCIVHGLAKSRTWLSKFHFHCDRKWKGRLLDVVILGLGNMMWNACGTCKRICLRGNEHFISL